MIMYDFKAVLPLLFQNEGPKRTLFDQLDDYRIDPARGEEGQVGF